MSQIQALLAKRRTIYQLGDRVEIATEALTNMIQHAVREAPSAFHSQSSRVVVLYGQAHQRVWSITEDALRQIVPAEQFAATQQRLDGFRAAFGTILFFEDQNVVKELQERFPLYADNFPKWAQESTAIAQYAVWLMLTEHNLGASIQHYNPLINEAVQQAWQLPESWQLLGQMPFGSIEGMPAEKAHMLDSERFRVFGA
ncbi:nitroreductase family protein [Wohlfahrtiimonas chitiniclastica]|uniref:nitroreductase family protein n=1 Tax=Wohlfahrtiimonas chitiniclastica TaxID=400946 RepID=UPI000B9947AF|nr:nitroreductase family protein [Wohlfahrtiimonas chitiniclastica]MBS7815053.1 nitroreductase family protein [Wohlfahrtiimonas chitiniclastica]MBS7827585.1 nitroreductase family protein [Wohlfahrtiimonas chitiniclastica]MBS7836378.1 nitroreductase family protein [Wohlfahrtiimonas chitiniclastica]OYQ76194.1 nitroreductase [Wohlfahrtiimonas chitiniclastica]